MDGGHGQRQPMSPAISASTVLPQQRQRQLQHHSARSAIADLFTLYLGMNSKQRAEDAARETSWQAGTRQMRRFTSQARKINAWAWLGGLPGIHALASNQTGLRQLPGMVSGQARPARFRTKQALTALNRDLPPRDEQFISDFEQLRMQFPDQEQLQAVTESVLTSFVLQCSSHAPQSEFLLFATRCLCARGHLRWDSLLPSLLNAVSSSEAPMGQGGSVTVGGPVTSSSSAVAVPNAPNFHPSNPTSPLSAINTIGSPTQSGIDQPIGANVSPIKAAEFSSPGQLGTAARGDQRWE